MGWSPKTNDTKRCELCGEKTCLVCNSIGTTSFTTEACRETFQIPNGLCNCNSEKVLYLLKCKVRLLILENPKLNFNISSITIKANTELSGKEIKKYPRN